ncbi:hypothetical protein POVWA1_046000 [Plasmodium ovale wallikeri]|uniref:Uncharacterized protein n=1 Tax=Plasmodium ovale wallikeri TaxID=864142 RepID=A0A1A8ZF25_PLAOA|nr:hypothetical protein POVWA1_046000 [Plasmodium ovale wallikeri]
MYIAHRASPAAPVVRVPIYSHLCDSSRVLSILSFKKLLFRYSAITRPGAQYTLIVHFRPLCGCILFSHSKDIVTSVRLKVPR